MTESTKPEREKVNDLLDSLEDSGWIVRDYNPNVDPYEPLSVEITVERSQDPTPELVTPESSGQAIKGVKGIVEDLEDGHSEGAPVEKVVSKVVSELDCTEDMAWNEIDRLKQNGEVYEPRTDHLRVT